ncbi:unnamed protein product [Victoria cruziana]
MGEAKWRLVLVPLFVGLLAAGAEDEPPVQIYPSNGGQLCASECSTCPQVCSSPPSPISPQPSLPSPPDFSYATPPMLLLPPPSPPPPPTPLSYNYPQTPSIFLPPPSPDQSPMFPYPYYFFYHNSGAPAATVASTALDLLTVFSLAAVLLVL